MCSEPHGISNIMFTLTTSNELKLDLANKANELIASTIFELYFPGEWVRKLKICKCQFFTSNNRDSISFQTENAISFESSAWNS